MGNIFKVFFGISSIFLLSGCDSFDSEKRQIEFKEKTDNFVNKNERRNFWKEKVKAWLTDKALSSWTATGQVPDSWTATGQVWTGLDSFGQDQLVPFKSNCILWI